MPRAANELFPCSICRDNIIVTTERGLLSSAHDLAEGGLAVALAESGIGGNLGATVEIAGSDRLDAILFSETCGKIRVLAKVQKIFA